MRETLKKNVRKYRVAKGLNRNEFAELAGITVSCLKQIENYGACNPETIDKVASALNIKPYKLIKE